MEAVRGSLTHRAFAQAGFQLGVLINDILLGSALIGELESLRSFIDQTGEKEAYRQ